jgi:hypothetical protein
MAAKWDTTYYWLKAPDRNVMLVDAIEMSISSSGIISAHSVHAVDQQAALFITPSQSLLFST